MQKICGAKLHGGKDIRKDKQLSYSSKRNIYIYTVPSCIESTLYGIRWVAQRFCRVCFARLAKAPGFFCSRSAHNPSVVPRELLPAKKCLCMLPCGQVIWIYSSCVFTKPTITQLNHESQYNNFHGAMLHSRDREPSDAEPEHAAKLP